MNHSPKYIRAWQSPAPDPIWKRSFDLVLAGGALVLATPVLLIAALAIKLTSPGPALFMQPRRGKEGREFSVLKLRTLKYDRCDPPDQRDVRPVEDNDPRVFPVGEFLRKRGLDEIPQLWNVIRGEMSIVGPRPHALPHDDHFLLNVPGYAYRYTVKPGITGWAQVNGSRGQIRTLDEAARRVELDREYIARMSLAFDIRVALRTIRIVLSGRDPVEAVVAPTSKEAIARVLSRHEAAKGRRLAVDHAIDPVMAESQN